MHRVQFVLQLLSQPVADFCHPTVVALAFGLLCLEVQLLQLFLLLLELFRQSLLAFPLGTHLGLLFAQIGYLLVKLLELAGGAVGTA